MIETNNYPKTALDRVFEEVANFFAIAERQDIKITRITPAARKAWTETWKPINQRQPPNGGWDWVYKNGTFRDNSRLFDMAIWGEQGVLSGLALGKLSKGQDILSIYYLEGSPDTQHCLKGLILPVIVQTVIEYARLRQIKAVRLIDPVPNLRQIYQKYGFQYKEKTLFGLAYCEKKIEDVA